MAKETLSHEPLPTKVSKKKNNIRFLATVTLSAAIGLSSLAGINIINELTGDENQPQPSPTEISPLTPIEQVPLASRGNIKVTYYNNKLNNFLIEVDKATVVAIEKDKNGKITDFAVSVIGDKITRNCNDINLNGQQALSCNLSGATLWFNVTENTAISESINDNAAIVGKGSDALGKNLKLGNVIDYIGAGTAYLEGSNAGNLESVISNFDSLNNLNEKVGESLPRTARDFSFIAGNISL